MHETSLPQKKTHKTTMIRKRSIHMFREPGQMGTTKAKMIDDSGTIARAARASATAPTISKTTSTTNSKLQWKTASTSRFKKALHELHQDPEASSSGRLSVADTEASSSGRLSVSLRVRLLDAEDSTHTHTQELETIREPLRREPLVLEPTNAHAPEEAHPLPQPHHPSILKTRTKYEPLYLKNNCTHRKNWKSLPPPTNLPVDPSMDDSSTSKTSSCTFTTSTVCDLKNVSTKSASTLESAQDDPNHHHHHHVGFASVMIRSYQQTLGDNPAVSCGPPIQLDWDYTQHDRVDIDLYESHKGIRRRNCRQLLIDLNYYRRKDLLTREYGFTPHQLAQARKAVDRVKFHRSVSYALSPLWKVEDLVQSACRKTKRIFRKGGKHHHHPQ